MEKLRSSVKIMFGQIATFLLPIFNNPFARNWSLLAISKVLCLVLGMLATIRIARALDPSGYGQFNVVLINANFGAVLAGLGLSRIVTRECARYSEKSRSLFFSSALVQFVAVFPVGLLLVFYVTYFTENSPFSMSTLAVVLMYIILMWQLLESLSFGHERMEFSAIISLGGSVLWVIFAWFSPNSFLTPLNTCVAFALLQAIKAVCFFLAINWAKLLKRTESKVDYKYLLKISLPFYWLAILTAVTNQLPILFLAERSGTDEVGFYSAGLKLATPIHVIIITLMMSLFPGLSKITLTDSEKYFDIVRRSLLGIILAGTGIASCIALFRYEIVALLFGKDFHNAGSALMFQIWYTALAAVFNLIGVTLAASDRQGWTAKLATIYALVAVPLLWIGSGYGATSLAIAMLLAAILNMTYHLYFFQKSLPVSVPVTFFLILFGILGSAMAITIALPYDLPVIIRFLLCLPLPGVLILIIIKTNYLNPL